MAKLSIHMPWVSPQCPFKNNLIQHLLSTQDSLDPELGSKVRRYTRQAKTCEVVLVKVFHVYGMPNSENGIRVERPKL